MTERSRLLPLLLAAVATLLFAAAGATIAAEQAHALKCKPACIPPPEEGFEEERPPPQPTPPPTRSMLVIGVGWNTGDPRTSAELLPSNSLVSNNAWVEFLNGTVNDFFAQQAAPAPFKKWQPMKGGEYMIQPPAGMILPGEREQRCAIVGEKGETDAVGSEFIDSVVNQAETRARQSGFNPDAYTTVVIHYSNSNVQCFGGVQRGRRTVIASRSSARHELGHFEGLGHATFLRCRDASGRVVTLSNECKTFPYSDPYSAMGSITDRAFGAIHANKLGWLSSQFFDVVAGDFTRTFFLRPFTGSVRTERALRLRDGGTTYWLEYRTRDGIDNPAFGSGAESELDGLVIHREPAPGESQLLDMTPGTEFGTGRLDGNDAPLPVGRSWTVPGGEMMITINSAGPSGVSVTLATRRVTMPDVRGMEVERAYASLRNAGFDPAPWNPVIDQTCSYLGVIAEQEPFPGTRWLPEQPVRLGVGEHPPFGCP